MYDMKLEAMTLNELHEESNRLQKMLIDGRPSEAMIRQVTGFMQQVDQRIAEVMYIERFKQNQKKIRRSHRDRLHRRGSLHS